MTAVKHSIHSFFRRIHLTTRKSNSRLLDSSAREAHLLELKEDVAPRHERKFRRDEQRRTFVLLYKYIYKSIVGQVMIRRSRGNSGEQMEFK